MCAHNINKRCVRSQGMCRRALFSMYHFVDRVPRNCYNAVVMSEV